MFSTLEPEPEASNTMRFMDFVKLKIIGEITYEIKTLSGNY